jgi:hypothetical protein
VAIASAENRPAGSGIDGFATLGLGALCLIWSLSLGSRLKIIGVAIGFLFLAFGFARCMRMGSNVFFYASPEAKRRALEARLLGRLDGARRTVGLDEVLDSEKLGELEESAQQWEEIENTMAGNLWTREPSRRERIVSTARDLMAGVVTAAMGDRPESATLPEVAAISARSQLAELAAAVAEATKELTSYARVSESGVNVALGEEFQSVKRLNRIVRFDG